MTTRIRLTRAQKVRIFDRHKGICHWCRQKIKVLDAWDVDHVIPLWAGGMDTQENMAPIHLDPCHKQKTGEEATGRAKELRMRANYLGIPKPGPKLPAGRNSDKTKTILNGVQPRRSGAQKHRDLMNKLYPWGIPE